jgi:hypothetical protein
MAEPDEKKRRNDIEAPGGANEPGADDSGGALENRGPACFLPCSTCGMLLFAWSHTTRAVEGWSEEQRRLFTVFQGIPVLSDQAATPEVKAVAAMHHVDETFDPLQRAEVRDVISAFARSLAGFVQDPLIRTDLMSYAGIMCSEPSRAELMQLFAQSNELSVELREWAREWVCIARHAVVRSIPGYMAGRTKFQDHAAVTQALRLPVELLMEARWNYFEAFDREMFDIPSPEMQDRIFDFFLGFGFNFFDAEEGFTLARLVEQQLRRHSFSEVASRLSLSQCITDTVGFVECNDLKETLRHLYSNVSNAQRNETVHALLASKREDGGYVSRRGRRGFVYMMKQLFKCGASPLVRDASGVLLIANMRCTRLRSVVSGQYVFENLRMDTETPRELEKLIGPFTPAKWTIELHHLFPFDFRERVRVLLLCNQRMGLTGAAHLSFDPLEIVIQWLAVGEVLGRDAVENEMAKLQ